MPHGITKGIWPKDKYLDKATDFTDIPKKDSPGKNRNYECPVCKGHGRWNLRLNARGDGKHFQQSCFQCRGWGWVSEKDATCVHEDKELSVVECRERGIAHFGICYHVVECTKCGRISAYDSSD